MIAASPLPPPPRIGAHGVLACLSFLIFFGVASMFSVVALIAPRPTDETGRRRFTIDLNRGFRLFLGFLRDVRLIDVGPLATPPELDGRAFLLVANHPSLLDAPLLLAAMPELVAVVKAPWFRSWMLGPLLRRCVHVAGPGAAGDEAELAPVVERIARALSDGLPVLAFPEATRSEPGSLRRFRRGAIEAALSAGAPIVPLFIGVDPPILGKGQMPWRLPSRTARYRFEWLEPVSEEVRARGSRAVASQLAERLGARLREHRHACARSRILDARDTGGMEVELR